MFRRFIASDTNNFETRTRELFNLHPTQLNALLEIAWEFRDNVATATLGSPSRRSALANLPIGLLTIFDNLYNTNNNTFNPRGVRPSRVIWDHLIYAYLIENTKVYDIFRKVLEEFLFGEKIGTPLDADTQSWLRNTEALFYSAPQRFSVCDIQSQIRPDANAYRRNNYYRMFGMDLNHGQPDGQPYPYPKADRSNREFFNTLEEFLQEIWVGISNFGNSSGENRTDNAAIANLARQLRLMMEARRQNGNLTRAEFCHVSMMSWFHLTLSANFPIITSLHAQASSEDQRLFKIAEKVGMKAHGKSYNFFRLADPLSSILLQIEHGTFDSPGAVSVLYERGTPQEVAMREIVTQISIATDRDMKVKRGKNLTTANTTATNGVSKELMF